MIEVADRGSARSAKCFVYDEQDKCVGMSFSTRSSLLHLRDPLLHDEVQASKLSVEQV